MFAFTKVPNPESSTACTLLVNDYVVRGLMGKMGFKFDPNDLTQFEAAYLMEVHKVYQEIEQNRLKKSFKSKG